MVVGTVITDGLIRGSLGGEVATHGRGTMAHGQLALFEAKLRTLAYASKTGLLGRLRKSSLYDQVQYDSVIEEQFIKWKLNEDPRIVCFFKFPPKFRIDTPRIILNYNPDWGIIRKNDDGMKLELVEETKGNADVSKLQFPDEARKIACAEKHFALLGIDYKVITGKEERWW